MCAAEHKSVLLDSSYHSVQVPNHVVIRRGLIENAMRALVLMSVKHDMMRGTDRVQELDSKHSSRQIIK